jgi:hypothetical protein
MHTDDDDMIFTMMAEHEVSDQNLQRPMLHACLVISQGSRQVTYDALFGFEDQESRSRIKMSTHTVQSTEVAGGRVASPRS